MRIASLSPSITEILFALGTGDQIVCTDQFSDYPEETKGISHLRDHQNISVEDLQAQNAELILTSTVIQENLKMRLESESMSVVHFDPRTLNQIYDCIRSLGVMLEAEKEASAVMRHMQQGFNTVKKKSGLLPRRPKLYIEEWPACAKASAGKPDFLAYASGNWVPEVARIAGGNPFDFAQGRQFSRTTGVLSPEVTLAQVQAWDPDMIILSWCGAGTSIDSKKIFLERVEWSGLRAVQENQIYVIDDSLLNRHGPRLVEGCQRLYGWMFEMLH